MEPFDSKVENKKYFTRPVFIFLTIVFVFASFAGGFLYGKQSGIRSVVPEGEGHVVNRGVSNNEYISEDVDFAMYWDVWNLLKETYLEQPVSEKDLFYGSLAGMLASIDDPYTVFFDPELNDQFMNELSGTFEGIGAEIGIKADRLTIIAPLSGTPASIAGLQAGDKVYMIDGEDTTGISVDYAVSKIRGPQDSEVVLTIYRNGFDELQDIAIVRDTIEVDSVRWEIGDDNIAYIEMSFFNRDTGRLFEDAVQEILTNDVQGIVVDLRNNPGGYLDQAVDVAGHWVEKNTVVIQRTRGQEQKYPTTSIARLKDIPTIVLVNAGSASASEIFAGALQDYGLATIIGMQTFGKGSVQDYSGLPDGSAVKITTAEWLTPLRRTINNEGITPDIEIEMTTEDFNSDIDPQMNKAVELLLGE